MTFDKALKLALILSAIATLTFMLCGCSYEKKLAKWCARCPKSDSTVIVRVDSTVVKTDTAFVEIPADTSVGKFDIECFFENATLREKMDSLMKAMGVKGPKARITNSYIKDGNKTTLNVYLDSLGYLNVVAASLSDSVMILQKEITYYKQELKDRSQVITVPCPDCSLNWFQKLFIGTGMIAWILLVLYLVLRGLKLAANFYPPLGGFKILGWLLKLL